MTISACCWCMVKESKAQLSSKNYCVCDFLMACSMNPETAVTFTCGHFNTVIYYQSTIILSYFKELAQILVTKPVHMHPSAGYYPVQNWIIVNRLLHIPYSGKIWRALNLAKWRKKVAFWYRRNLNLAIWNCTCDVIVALLACGVR